MLEYISSKGKKKLMKICQKWLHEDPTDPRTHVEKSAKRLLFINHIRNYTTFKSYSSSSSSETDNEDTGRQQ